MAKTAVIQLTAIALIILISTLINVKPIQNTYM